jgi:hypothetical protein
MNNAQVVAAGGAMVASFLKVAHHLEALGYDTRHGANVVMNQWHDLVGSQSSITGGQHADRSAQLSSPLQGTAQNSGVGINC